MLHRTAMPGIRKMFATAGIASAVLAGAATPALAAPEVTQIAPVCTLTVTSLQANDLQEPPKDEILLKLGGSVFDAGDFVDDQTKSASQMGNPRVDFIDLVNVRIIENDFAFGKIDERDEVLKSFNQACTAGSFTAVATGFNSIYTLKYTVTVNP